MTTVKFVQLSPATTALLATRLSGLIGLGITIKQTVATFALEPGAVMQLLDDMIRDEIPGAGPSGKNVKLLREVKRRLRDRLAGMDEDHSKVVITTAPPVPAVDPLREELLDIFEALWDAGTANGYGRPYVAAERLTALVGTDPDGWLPSSTVREWLDRHL